MQASNHRKELHNKDWIMPGLFTLCVVIVVACITWLYQSTYLERHRKDLAALSRQVVLTINSDLEISLGYLRLLAEAMSEGRLKEEEFRERSTAFVQTHPGMINITWADSDFIIRWTAPYEQNKQVLGLKLSLPEPERASREAKATGRPVFTRPFTVIQGVPAFEVYVPVFKERKFIGTFGGVFGVKNVLLHATPTEIASHAHLSILDKNGTTLAEISPSGGLTDDCTVSNLLIPPGYGTTLQVSDQHASFMIEWLLISMIGLSLALGILLTLGRLKKQVSIRERAEEHAARSEARLRSIYQAVHAGVLLQDTNGVILHANEVACKIFKMSEDEIIGRKSIDPIWNMVDEEGNDIPGEEHPSMLTLKTKEPINNAIRGLFADNPEKKIWLSINTQPIFNEVSGEVKEVLVTFHDVTRNKHLQDDLEYLTVHDPLTGLLNRRFLEEEAVKEVARAERYKQPISFLMIDIDQFKRINDRYGHKTGDKALCDLAENLSELIRESDYLARFGGEEFLLILPDTPAVQARSLAEKLRQHIEKTSISTQCGEALTMTISIGVATYPENGADWEALFKAADSALYRAKENGRNQVVIAD